MFFYILAEHQHSFADICNKNGARDTKHRHAEVPARSWPQHRKTAAPGKAGLDLCWTATRDSWIDSIWRDSNTSSTAYTSCMISIQGSEVSIWRRSLIFLCETISCNLSSLLPAYRQQTDAEQQTEQHVSHSLLIIAVLKTWRWQIQWLLWVRWTRLLSVARRPAVAWSRQTEIRNEFHSTFLEAAEYNYY